MNASASLKSIVILGATGLVGGQLLTLALNNPTIDRIIAPTRKPLPSHQKLENPIVDFADLPTDATWWQADAVLCALGTTIKSAGSKQGFHSVDYGYVMAAAHLAKQSGCNCFVLNSSLGADAGSNNFYLKTKGELEQALQALAFRSLTIVRPSLLDGGPRPEQRIGEEIGLWFGTRLSAIIPKRYRPISTKRVAQTMLEAALKSDPGLHIIESDQLHY